MICLRKFILVKRASTALKYLARSYYFFIPVICLCFSFAYGASISFRDQIATNLPKYQTSIQNVINKNFQFDIELDIQSNQSINESLDDLVTKAKTEFFAKLKLKPNYQKNTQKFVVTILESPVGTSLLKSKINDQIVSSTGTDKALVNEVFEIKVNEIISSDTIIKIADYQVKQMFSSVIILILVTWVVLLFLPIAEIIFANRRYRKSLLVG